MHKSFADGIRVCNCFARIRFDSFQFVFLRSAAFRFVHRTPARQMEKRKRIRRRWSEARRLQAPNYRFFAPT
jgi:hypothetical protein